MDVGISGSAQRVGYKILLQENLVKASVIITNRSKTISCTGVLTVKLFVPVWINRIWGAPCISFWNESCTFELWVLKSQWHKTGEPKKIFACRGEGHRQLRVTMITHLLIRPARQGLWNWKRKNTDSPFIYIFLFNCIILIAMIWQSLGGREGRAYAP